MISFKFLLIHIFLFTTWYKWQTLKISNYSSVKIWFFFVFYKKNLFDSMIATLFCLANIENYILKVEISEPFPSSHFRSLPFEISLNSIVSVVGRTSITDSMWGAQLQSYCTMATYKQIWELRRQDLWKSPKQSQPITSSPSLMKKGK